MKPLLLALCACTTALPPQQRAPSPGIAPHPYPDTWREPAVLCIGGMRMGWTFEHGWRCM